MIRDVRASDAPDLLRFLRDYFPEEQAILGFQPDGFYQVIARVFRWDLRFLLGLMRLFGRRIFRFMVVEEDGHVVATTLLTLPSRAGYISSVAVDSNYRRRGLARALLEEARTTTRQAHRPYLALDVLTENAPARTLYDALGYRPLRELRMMVCEVSGTVPSNPVPGLRAFTKHDTKPLVALAQAALPPEVAEVLPVTDSQFNTSGAVSRALTSESAQWVLDRGHGPEAYVEASRSPAMAAANVGAPVLAESVDPATAAALVRVAVAWCSARGARRIVGQVPLANARAKAALEGGGFHEAIGIWTLYRKVA
jgi:ribosomal protein S18 acetylase RimI-like enzyme